MFRPSSLASFPVGLAVLCLVTSPFCSAQAASPQPVMNNDAVLKLSSSGLSEDLIVATINAMPGRYETSTDALIALKKAGLTDREIAAMLLRNGASNPVLIAPFNAPLAPSTTATFIADPPLDPNLKPRIYLQSESHGTNIKARRDQSMEMSKDFEKTCPAVRISINPSLADYTVMLNHIENDFSRDNQIQIADKAGDLISRTREGGTINANVKKACGIILADWSKRIAPPASSTSTPGN